MIPDAARAARPAARMRGGRGGGRRGQGEDRGGPRASAVVKDRVPFSTRGKGTRLRRGHRGPTQPLPGATHPVRRRERPVAPSLAPSDGNQRSLHRVVSPGEGAFGVVQQFLAGEHLRAGDVRVERPQRFVDLLLRDIGVQGGVTDQHERAGPPGLDPGLRADTSPVLVQPGEASGPLKLMARSSSTMCRARRRVSASVAARSSTTVRSARRLPARRCNSAAWRRSRPWWSAVRRAGACGEVTIRRACAAGSPRRSGRP